MKKLKTIKGFDALKMKENIQRKIYAKIRNMNNREMIAYFEKSAQEGPFGDLYRQLIAKSRKKPVLTQAREPKAKYR
jgi:hypothetical protein